ncbi:MAG: hypothetical protein Kow00109_15630 [Acidobacteriota bacterium]
MRVVPKRLGRSAAFLLMLWIAGCTSRSPKITEPVRFPASTQTPTPTTAEPSYFRASRERLARDILTDVDRLVARGKELYLAQQTVQAELLFGEAEELLDLSSGDPSLDMRLRVRKQVLAEELRRFKILAAAEFPEPPFPLAEELSGPPSAREVIAALDLYTVEVDPALEDLVAEDIRETPFDFPVVVNREVLQFLDYFQRQGRDRTQEAMQRAGPFLPHFRRIFAEEKVPIDLVYMAHVESLFKANAYSRARARGIWQFMAGTARLYGLQVNWWLDERLDFFKSTRAAARHLRDLREEFGDWYLALAAYNVGPGRIYRIFRRHGRLDYWTMARRRLLPRETRNYVPSILAAMIIYRHPERYGFEPPEETPLSFEEVSVPFQVDLQVVADLLGVPKGRIQELNPELVRGITPFGRQDYRLRVPAGFRERAAHALAQLPPEKRLRWAHHRVRKGETLSHIATRYGVSVRAIAETNRLRSIHRLSVGQDLIIPLSDWRAGMPAAAAGDVHIVRRGESLYRIARRYGLRVEDLRAWNGLEDRDLIYPGQELRLSGERKGGSR